MRTIALICLLAFGSASFAPSMLEAKTKSRKKQRSKHASDASAMPPPAAGRTPVQSPNPVPPAKTQPPAPGTAAPPE